MKEDQHKTILTGISNTISLLGGSEEIVNLLRNPPKDLLEKIKDYNYNLITEVKSRLANCTTESVDIIGHKLN